MDLNKRDRIEQKIQSSPQLRIEVGNKKNTKHRILEEVWALGTRMSFETAAHLVEKLLTSDRRPLPQQLLDANILCEPNTIAHQLHRTLRQLKFKQNATLLSRKMRTRPGRGALERSNILPSDSGPRFRERTVLLEANIRHIIHADMTRVTSPVNSITNSLVYMDTRDGTQ
jgi:hypothetical protein